MAAWHPLTSADTLAALVSGREDLTAEQAREQLVQYAPIVLRRVHGDGPLTVLAPDRQPPDLDTAGVCLG